MNFYIYIFKMPFSRRSCMRVQLFSCFSFFKCQFSCSKSQLTHNTLKQIFFFFSQKKCVSISFFSINILNEIVCIHGWMRDRDDDDQEEEDEKKSQFLIQEKKYIKKILKIIIIIYFSLSLTWWVLKLCAKLYIEYK